MQSPWTVTIDLSSSRLITGTLLPPQLLPPPSSSSRVGDVAASRKQAPATPAALSKAPAVAADATSSLYRVTQNQLIVHQMLLAGGCRCPEMVRGVHFLARLQHCSLQHEPARSRRPLLSRPLYTVYWDQHALSHLSLPFQARASSSSWILKAAATAAAAAGTAACTLWPVWRGRWGMRRLIASSLAPGHPYLMQHGMALPARRQGAGVCHGLKDPPQQLLLRRCMQRQKGPSSRRCRRGSQRNRRRWAAPES